MGRNERKWHSGDISRVELTRVRGYEEEKWGRPLGVSMWPTTSVLAPSPEVGQEGRRAGFVLDIVKLCNTYSPSEEDSGFCLFF